MDVYCVDSPYQKGRNVLRILEPRRPAGGRPRFQVWVLPVNPGLAEPWGDGLETLRRSGLHHRHGFVAVAPSFSDWPWYADHPGDPGIRQESYLLNTLLPLVDHRYPGARRLLLGFSKSGLGALTLLLRHPDLFHAAAAWDAPLTQMQPDEFGMGPIYGTPANFEHYCIPRLLAGQIGPFRAAKRISLSGYGNFREPMRQAHAWLDQRSILHEFVDGPCREHRWDSGWLEPAVDSLVGLLPDTERRTPDAG